MSLQPVTDQPLVDPALTEDVPPGVAGYVDIPRATPRDRAGWEIAAAVVGITLLVRRRLAGMQPDASAQKARDAWTELAPMWLKLALPAVKQAYMLGRVEGMSEDELTELATDYAGAMGEYINETSAEAFQAALDQQLAGRWSMDLAWHRASAAYGLDKRDIKAYILTATRENTVEPIPAAARALVDRAFMRRAENLGIQEAYSAEQAGQAIAWMMMERDGRLAAGYRRGWEMGHNEEHCATCLELADQVVALSEPFVFVSGAKIWAPRAHPGCHCRIRLVPPEILAKGDQLVKVAGIALRAADTGRVLMLQRAADATDPAGGKWEFAGGHLERGESPIKGAIREWEEENRRRLPLTTYVGSWRHGIYEGFVLEIPFESAIQSHRRGRVINPDDPDGDQVEAIAWWDPKHLAGNKAVRPELLASLTAVRRALHGEAGATQGELEKAFDPKERRDTSGRWSRVDYAEPESTKSTNITNPEEAATLTPAGLRPSGLRSSTLRPATLRPSALQAALEAHSPFLSSDEPLKGRQRPRNTSRSVVLLGNVERPVEPTKQGAYFLPVDDYHEHTPERPIGARYDLGELVDFDTAASRPVASANTSPWNLLSNDHIFASRIGRDVTRAELEQHWGEILPRAMVAWNTAMSDVANPDNRIADRLSDTDLQQIYRLAGYEGEDNSGRMRQNIIKAVEKVDLGLDDSLAMAYGDYVTWSDPRRFLGRHTGGRLEESLDAAEGAGIDVRDFVTDPLPVEQIFGFEGGLHPRTKAADGEARLEGAYVPVYHRYRSALHDTGLGTQPLRFGLRETYMAPFVDHNGFWVPGQQG